MLEAVRTESLLLVEAVWNTWQARAHQVSIGAPEESSMMQLEYMALEAYLGSRVCAML